eukprot:Awhi_evm1s10722
MKCLGFSLNAIELAKNTVQGRSYLWATEFENVHSTFYYAEPKIVKDGQSYLDSEAFYHAQKPKPFNANLWNNGQRDDVMREAIRLKVLGDPSLNDFLLSTGDHPLVAVKPDSYWGVHPVKGGENMLAKLWMQLRDELRQQQST